MFHDALRLLGARVTRRYCSLGGRQGSREWDWMAKRRNSPEEHREVNMGEGASHHCFVPLIIGLGIRAASGILESQRIEVGNRNHDRHHAKFHVSGKCGQANSERF